MKGNRAFSILELLIAITISIILMSAIYYTYSTFFMGIKSERISVEQEIEKVVGLEFLRLDLEHLGYGVGKNSVGSDYIIYEIDNSNRKFTIRTTLNNSNNNTIGWRICRNGNIIKNDIEGSNNNFVYVDDNGYVKYIFTDGSCPSDTGIFIGYPFDSKAAGCNFNGINFCSKITYYLSKTNLPRNCNRKTYNLLRKVNNAIGGNPFLSCVADIKITVDMDTNGDGTLDLVDVDDVSTYSPDQLRAFTKRVNVYILYQEATSPDPKYKFKNYQTDGNGNYMEIDGQRLYLPVGFENYKWKTIKISVKPMSIIR